MKKVILLWCLLLAMGTNAQNITKKCKTCGKPLVQCQYKGKHPAVVEQNKRNTGYVNGHQWVDLGLSVKWATCNVGANSPSEYGDHYAWGEIIAKSNYEWSNYFDSQDGTDNSWGTATYKHGGQTRITPSSGRDTARENWGGTWRMPTYAEIKELCKKCKWTWTSHEGHNGYKVTGPNGNSIFLPAAGWGNGTSKVCVGERGCYLSSTLSSEFNVSAYNIWFTSTRFIASDDGYRFQGDSVRPVTK